MHFIHCACGRSICTPCVISCPYCHKNLFNEDPVMVRKHIRTCSGSTNPYQYSEHKCGRPKKEPRTEYFATQDIHLDIFRRACQNCGTRCNGSDKGYCERWSRKRISDCPFCSSTPYTKTEGDVILEIICPRCNLSMKIMDGVDATEALVSRWNRDVPP